MTYEEVKKLLDTSDGNLICKQFCIFPNQIAADIKEIVHEEYEYGYIVIGVSNSGGDYSFDGIDRHINMSIEIGNRVSWNSLHNDVRIQ